MIMLLDTSTRTCFLEFCLEDSVCKCFKWDADRDLAKGLLNFINKSLTECSLTWTSLSGIGVKKGPGSFTGLRIGLTVANTIADAQKILIVGAVGDGWRAEALKNLKLGLNEKLVMPFYDKEPNITNPSK